mmetsp:Transcript_23528/g.44255  ORF Transcript_23528/g.44255 Transcript_23528/m.44255 type:complete len:178 (+) Transcript_23528:173-706(+)
MGDSDSDCDSSTHWGSTKIKFTKSSLRSATSTNTLKFNLQCNDLNNSNNFNATIIKRPEPCKFPRSASIPVHDYEVPFGEQVDSPSNLQSDTEESFGWESAQGGHVFTREELNRYVEDGGSGSSYHSDDEFTPPTATTSTPPPTPTTTITTTTTTTITSTSTTMTTTTTTTMELRAF